MYICLSDQKIIDCLFGLVRKYLGDLVASKGPFIAPLLCRILNTHVTNPDLRGHGSEVRFHAHGQ